jgi:hypothetical protein
VRFGAQLRRNGVTTAARRHVGLMPNGQCRGNGRRPVPGHARDTFSHVMFRGGQGLRASPSSFELAFPA